MDVSEPRLAPSVIERLPPIVIPHGYKPKVDWREKKDADQVMNAVRNQKSCQACWAMAAVVVVESTRKRRFPDEKLKILSPQMLIDCVCQNPPEENIDPETGCYPYTVNKAFDWFIKNSVQSEEDYPYVARRGNCSPAPMPKESLKIKGYKTIQGHERKKLLERVVRHPVAAVIDISREFLKLKDQIYQGPLTIPEEKPAKHAVVVIGYGTDEKTERNYWLIQSSWGDDWAMGGVGKVDRDIKTNGNYLIRRISYPLFFNNDDSSPSTSHVQPLNQQT